MNIGILSHSYPSVDYPYDATFVKDHVDLLKDTHTVKVFVPSVHAVPFTDKWRRAHSPLIQSDSVQSTRIRYWSFPRQSFPNIIQKSITKKVLQEIEQFELDLLHFHFAYPSSLALPALRKLGIPCVLQLHGTVWYQSYHKSSMRPLLKDILDHSDLIIPVANNLRDHLVEAYPEIQYKIEVLPNCLNFDTFTPLPFENKSQYKQQLGWDPETTHCLSVANIRREKGIDILIESIAHSDRLKQIQFHIVGRYENNEYTDYVSNKVAEYNLTNITFYGALDRSKLPVYYTAADFFVLPSRREAFPVSLLEALACGTPVVSTRCGGPQQVINDRVGYIVDREDSDKLKLALEKMAKTWKSFDPSLLQEYIITHYGAEAYRDTLEKKYYRLVDN